MMNHPRYGAVPPPRPLGVSATAVALPCDCAARLRDIDAALSGLQAYVSRLARACAANTSQIASVRDSQATALGAHAAALEASVLSSVERLLGGEGRRMCGYSPTAASQTWSSAHKLISSTAEQYCAQLETVKTAMIRGVEARVIATEARADAAAQTAKEWAPRIARLEAVQTRLVEHARRLAAKLKAAEEPRPAKGGDAGTGLLPKQEHAPEEERAKEDARDRAEQTAKEVEEMQQRIDQVASQVYELAAKASKEFVLVHRGTA
eukprot:m51a1_g3826 hypothetical protein (265) ;mRNA; f:301003-302099